MTDKDPPVKALFAFTGGFILAEELGDGTRHRSAKFLYILKTRKKS
jgi:hypothetical protein